MEIYARLIHEISKKYIKPNDQVFDCGCGDGFHTSILKNYSQNIFGADLENRTKKEFNVNFVKISEYDFGEKNKWNAVFSFDVIEHVEDDCKYLEELVSITKKGGLIIVGTPNRKRLSNRLISLVKGPIKYPYYLGYSYESGGDIIHLREYTDRDLIGLANQLDNVETLELRAFFLGLYTRFGPMGFVNIKSKFLKKYAQHLFMVLVKK